MSDQEKNKIQYNASDIIKYLKGELSPLEMHAMEKAALDDPLLADALDGMQQSFEKDQLQKFPADILEIRNRLSRRIGQQKIPNPSPFIFGWKVAAAVLVILFAGGLTVYMINQQKAGVQTFARSVDTPSKTKADSTIRSSQPAVSNAEPEKKSIADADVKKTEQASSSVARSEKKHKPVHHAPKTVLPDTAFEAAAMIDKKDDVAKNSLSPNTLTEKQVTAPAAHFDYKNRATNLSSFYGKVTDEHNKPIASAFIASKDKKVQALTDNNGNFKLNIGKQDTVISVEISSSGYDPAFITLNTHGVPNIVMLRETSSSGGAYDKSSARKKIIPEQQLDQDAVPEHGWDDYSKYLQKNKRPPNDSLGLKGIVIVSFTVDKKKRLSDFYIEQSLGPDYDTEAIRLIKEGPSWKLIKKKSATVVVVVGF